MKELIFNKDEIKVRNAMIKLYCEIFDLKTKKDCHDFGFGQNGSNHWQLYITNIDCPYVLHCDYHEQENTFTLNPTKTWNCHEKFNETMIDLTDKDIDEIQSLLLMQILF